MDYKDWFPEQEVLIDFLIELDSLREDTSTTLYLKIVELHKDSFIYPLGFALTVNTEGKYAVDDKLAEYNLTFESCSELYEDSDIFSYTCFNIREVGNERNKV